MIWELRDGKRFLTVDAAAVMHQASLSEVEEVASMHLGILLRMALSVDVRALVAALVSEGLLREVGAGLVSVTEKGAPWGVHGPSWSRLGAFRDAMRKHRLRGGVEGEP